MDPNENLREQRACIETLRELEDEGIVDPEFETAANRLAELASALDEWLCNGGFKPDAWTHRAKPSGKPIDLRIKDELVKGTDG